MDNSQQLLEEQRRALARARQIALDNARRAEATNMVRQIDRKISKAENVKHNLNFYAIKLQNHIDTWNRCKKKFNGKYSVIRVEGKFEGDAALKLQKYITAAVMDINSGINSATNLKNKIDRQKDTVTNYINTLYNQRRYWDYRRSY